MPDYSKIIFITGDVHGHFSALNAFINAQIRQNRRMKQLAEKTALEVMILQCGDFAFFWPGCDNSRSINNKVGFVKDGQVKIYWCAGNHEDHDRLDNLFKPDNKDNFAEVAPGVIYARFGATLDLGAGARVLFAGGAESHDRENRVEGVSWWPQEGISKQDMDRLDAVPGADWIISHTAPYYLDVPLRGHLLPEPSRRMLDAVFDRYQPKYWYFGHFHNHCQGYYDGCDWECLDCLDIGRSKSWERVCLP